VPYIFPLHRQDFSIKSVLIFSITVPECLFNFKAILTVSIGNFGLKKTFDFAEKKSYNLRRRCGDYIYVYLSTVKLAGIHMESRKDIETSFRG
jgi:hypothetical protein